MRRSWLRLFWAGIVVAGAIAGYLATSGFGERLLQQEIETQLSRRLGGPVEVSTVSFGLDDGLRFEFQGLEAFPNPVPTRKPALRVHRVLAWIDIPALLIGRLEASTLILEGPQLQLEEAPDGSFAGLPLATFAPNPPIEHADSIVEQIARRLKGLDSAASAFVDDFHAADRIEIRDGSVHWTRPDRPDDDGSPAILRLELINGVGARNWLSGAVSLDASAVLLDGQHAPCPIEIGAHRTDSPHFDWSLTLSKVPLDLARVPLADLTDIDRLSGSLDARFDLRADDTGEQRLSFEGEIHDATFSLRGSDSILEREKAEFGVHIAFDSRSVRILEGRLTGQRLRLVFEGIVDRPIEPISRARIESHLVGVQLEDLTRLASRIGRDSDFGITLARLTEWVESGAIRSIDATGTARLEHWQALFTGETRDLPDGFLLGASFSDAVFGTGVDDRIEGLEGEVEWRDDRLSLRNMRGEFRGIPLPRMNATLDGVSQLIRNADLPSETLHSPPPLPGLEPLAQLLKPRDPNSLPPVKAIGLAVDRLDHPIFRWSLRDLRVLVEPQRGGLKLYVREGTWGGASIEGEVLWFASATEPTVDIHLGLGPPPIGNPENELANISEAPPPLDIARESPDRWGSGRFEIEFRPRARLPFQHATGFFRLDAAELVGQDIEIEVAGSGQFAARVRVDLSRAETIGLDLSFALTESRAEELCEFIALPPDFATGDFGATGSLTGRVRPDTSFIAELDGRIRIDAKKGRVRTNVPLVLRLAKATEGYNPFSNQDELPYDAMSATLDFEHGRLIAKDFELEGPLRAFAKARIDTNVSGGEIHAVVGIFLFRTTNQILGTLPLVRSFLPGSKRGLVGAYFEVKGPLSEPEVDVLEMQTFISAVPDAIKAPFKVLRYLFDRSETDS